MDRATFLKTAAAAAAAAVFPAALAFDDKLDASEYKWVVTSIERSTRWAEGAEMLTYTEWSKIDPTTTPEWLEARRGTGRAYRWS